MSLRAELLLMLFASHAAMHAYGDTGTFETFHCSAGQPQTLKHSEKNSVGIVMLYGTTRATTPGQMLDNMSTQCAGLYGELEEASFSQGFCEWADGDGDRIFFRYERQGTKGTFRSLSGVGKYQTMTMEGTYVFTRFPPRPGMLQGCAHYKGRWERR